jgi:tRNA pseudouridine38-40 synthase
MIGYSGSGYHGLQIMPNTKTVEGDLFKAFVAAGAISKANADDPKKSQLVRCARTDRGVHAAGNLLSLKLIIEDPDVVQKINDNLPPQIRVWGFERTTGSFNCYTACDSRWYEYLIPTHAFVPPHPSSWLAKALKTIEEEDGTLSEVQERQNDVSNFWTELEEAKVNPLLDSFHPDIRNLIEKILYNTGTVAPGLDEDELELGALNEEPSMQQTPTKSSSASPSDEPLNRDEERGDRQPENLQGTTVGLETEPPEKQSLIDPELQAAIKSVKEVYIHAKKAYRISPMRLQRVQHAFEKYEGTHNFHNYTVRKSPLDPSAKRFIRSFKVNPEPVIIQDTEWLSLKVHGQSFMMHQIRKMVALVALLVRCGCTLDRMTDSFSQDIYNIPKAPALGLLLERPVFDTYNAKAKEFAREKLDFSKFEAEMLAFKQKEIYDKIFQEEGADNVLVAPISALPHTNSLL